MWPLPGLVLNFKNSINQFLLLGIPTNRKDPNPIDLRAQRRHKLCIRREGGIQREAARVLFFHEAEPHESKNSIQDQIPRNFHKIRPTPQRDKKRDFFCLLFLTIKGLRAGSSREKYLFRL